MSLFSALSVSASGMSAQRARTELLVENLANADTTRTPEGGPYRRKDAVFAADPSRANQFEIRLMDQRAGFHGMVAAVQMQPGDPAEFGVHHANKVAQSLFAPLVPSR